jgi:hypothetical protein
MVRIGGKGIMGTFFGLLLLGICIQCGLESIAESLRR